VDNDPGTQMNNGIPSTFSFFLCNGNNFPTGCGLMCFITGPDTSCSDLVDTQEFTYSTVPSFTGPIPNPDEMSLWAFADYPWGQSREREVVGDLRSRQSHRHPARTLNRETEDPRVTPGVFFFLNRTT